MLTKESIVRMLESDDRAVARALVVLTARQTHDEQASEQTRYLNGRGYRPCHARMGASMSKFFQRTGYLTPKQVAYWRVKDRTGSMRIGIYAGQLLEEAQAKASAKAASTPKTPIVESLARKAGWEVIPVSILKLSPADEKEKARLEYELGMVMDSDDPKMVGAASDELDAFMRQVRAKAA